ncbi:MAG: hypothetical protein Q9170_001216 [Blastenia crenularia]
MTLSAVAISAPGKVLLAGGYLVLDRQHTGLVFGLSARIHVHVQELPTSLDVAHSEVIVRSPQFTDAEWRYRYRETENEGGVQVVQMESNCTSAQAQNKFVETALAYALSYVSSTSRTDIGCLSITIVADTDYYSYPGTTDSIDPARFVNFNVPLAEVHKTGLGSSAALVTSFTAAVLAFYLDQSQLALDLASGKARLHNLAQAAHCAAQGKVGSGFDVAAAVYGSCVYRRFSPSILENLGEVGSPEFSGRLKAVVEDTNPSKKWDVQINKLTAVIPRGLSLLMCDVDCGSETVGMVKKVLTWRKEKPDEAALLWATLQKGGEELAGELQRLALWSKATHPDYETLSDTISAIRSLIREMSVKADVPIEPDVQTVLLNTCCQIRGVVGGVVPGAGGYDAIALLVEHEAIPSLQRFLSTYTTANDHGDGPVVGKVKLLSVKQETEGLKREKSQIQPMQDASRSIERLPSAGNDSQPTAPIESTEIDDPPSIDPPQKPQWPLNPNIHETQVSEAHKDDTSETNLGSSVVPMPAPHREPLSITSANAGPVSTSSPPPLPPLPTPTRHEPEVSTSISAVPHPLTREKTGPAIGPPSDKPIPNPQESDSIGFTLFITLLLISGARHPFKMDERYLKKRNVNVDGNNPVNMSVYTLKELIWREWRDDWEIRPSSPSSIRLIYFGKLLEDKSRLHDCRFEAGLTPHVVHMTIKPQEIVDEEDAKMAKTGNRDRDANEGSAGCRCIIL